MKRKASMFEEPVVSSDRPSMSYSPSCSNTTSPESIKAVAGHGRLSTQWNVDSVPYINLRTQKRYRDNRPNAETIHQNTLAKLFGAQRHMHMEEQQQQQQQQQEGIVAWQTKQFGLSEELMEYTSVTTKNIQPKSNQRSINSFFGGSSLDSHSNLRATHAEQTLHTNSNTLQSTGDCEGCGGPLQCNDGNLGDLSEMDLDPDLQLDDRACVSCCKRVCDMCAVRGNDRVCLECAVPGAG